MLSRPLVSVSIASLALYGLMVIILVGGCPQQQVPQPEPEPNDANDIVTPDEPNSGGNERPIPPPVIDPNGVNGGGDGDGDGDGGDGGDGDGGGDGGDATVSLRVNEPTNPEAVRPGTIVELVFKLTDPKSMVTQTEFLVARDENADGQPDGNPVIVTQIAATAGTNTVPFDTAATEPLLTDGLGKFLLGVRYETSLGERVTNYGAGVLTVDAVPPEAAWVSPEGDHLVNPTFWTVRIQTEDNSKHTVRVYLDTDTTPNNGYAGVLVGETEFNAGSAVREFTAPLSVDAGTYFYYVIVSDGIEPPTAFYAPNIEVGGGALARLSVTNRLVGEFELGRLDPDANDYSNLGAILQGFNFNDLAGSAMASVPDLDGDGHPELLVGARFGKPNLVGFNGQGWGEAYLIYGGGRLSGVNYLNATTVSVPGVAFRGVRAVLNTPWTEGLSDITVLPDMDGDEKPELVFSFPRVESVTLAHTYPLQHLALEPTIWGMGFLEMDAEIGGQWLQETAQFTRGGMVIVSSQNDLLVNRNQITRKSDRILDLHEVGQMFTSMGRPGVQLYLKRIEEIPPAAGEIYCSDCVPNVWDEDTECPEGEGQKCDPNDPTNPACPCECQEGCEACGGIAENPNETPYRKFKLFWDVWLGGTNDPMGPGGFHQAWTVPAANPPLANPRAFEVQLPPNDEGPCLEGEEDAFGCINLNEWYVWETLCGTSLSKNPSWQTMGGQAAVWTGFYGNISSGGEPLTYVVGQTGIPPTSIGARVLGQSVDDRFGSSLSNDGTFLYISAPDHTALAVDINMPLKMPSDRVGSGVVYILRTVFRDPQGRNAAQLWAEPGQRWPYPDAQLPQRLDYSMPTPHQYLIQTVGSWRWNYNPEAFRYDQHPCYPQTYEDIYTETSRPGTECNPYDTQTELAGNLIAHTFQIVGPAQSTPARLSHVRAVGDVNGDGVQDVAVGSEFIEDPADPGVVVGAIYFVFGRPNGWEGHMLLDDLHRDLNDPERLTGFMLKGTSPAAPIARVFDRVGDFDGDGIDDVVVGSEGGGGEVVVILGSPTLESPANGWTIPDLVEAGRAVRFTAAAGELLGANVAGAGDVDGDGYADILLAAPGAVDNRGAVYLVYGGPNLKGNIPVDQRIGTVDLPGARLVGRRTGDQVGGGVKIYAYDVGSNGYMFNVYSRGVAPLGDLDGDGRADFGVSAMVADVNSRTDSGEVYVLYGRGD